MSNSRRGGNRERRERLVAVAVGKDKYSLQALHWAVDNFLTRGQTLRLVHVLQKPINPVNPDDGGVGGGDRQVDNQNMDFFLPLRSLCARRQIQCEVAVLEDTDVAKALIGYVHQFEIDTLFVGAVPKSGISRLFKGTDIPSTVLKLAPDFCNVYIISKRKVAAARPATRSIPTRAQSLNDLATSDTENEGLFDDDVPLDINSTAAGTLTSSVSLNDSLGHSLRSPIVLDPCRLSNVGPPPGGAVVPSFYSGRRRHSKAKTLTDYSFLLDESSSSAESSKIEEDNDETRRLRIELKHTMDLYHAACKEALTVKQQMIELQKWKRKYERRMRESLPSLTTVDDTTRRVVEKEVQKRVALVRRKLMGELEQSQYQSHLVDKYRGLFHILVVIFLYYFYFTILVFVKRDYLSQNYT
ncbi:hypothetical protein like AT5G20310 [Hibiscus trionum]|uniref:RING-type E3 ubiquitin transferase n=1 Tax=Hibiscus trionum TaxID=183268 RepID=A0A9W7HTY7_HIBTR|nr:hypothetical protein like AT5G20310 [Hibiscus trionum]